MAITVDVWYETTSVANQYYIYVDDSYFQSGPRLIYYYVNSDLAAQKNLTTNQSSGYQTLSPIYINDIIKVEILNPYDYYVDGVGNITITESSGGGSTISTFYQASCQATINAGATTAQITVVGQYIETIQTGWIPTSITSIAGIQFSGTYIITNSAGAVITSGNINMITSNQDNTVSAQQIINISGLTAGVTYYFSCSIVSVSSLNYPSREASVSNSEFTTNLVRPASFSWDTEKISGKAFNLTALEWTKLQDNISRVSYYKTSNIVSWNYFATQGGIFKVEMYNEVVDVINALYRNYVNPTATPIGKHRSGDPIYASYLNILQERINAIP